MLLETVIPFLSMVFSWTLALIFATAAYHKISTGARFRASFAAYRLVPESLTKPAVVIVTVLEIIVVLGCLALLPAGLWLAAALLAAYGAAMAVNLARGNSFIDCGCGDEPTPISRGLVLRNGVLAVGALAAAGAVGAVSLSLPLAMTAALAAATGHGIYVTIEQLFANRGRHLRLWQGVG